MPDQLSHRSVILVVSGAPREQGAAQRGLSIFEVATARSYDEAVTWLGRDDHAQRAVVLTSVGVRGGASLARYCQEIGVPSCSFNHVTNNPNDPQAWVNAFRSLRGPCIVFA